MTIEKSNNADKPPIGADVSNNMVQAPEQQAGNDTNILKTSHSGGV